MKSDKELAEKNQQEKANIENCRKIAEQLKISVAQVRRLLEDDKEGTVLNDIKILLK